MLLIIYKKLLLFKKLSTKEELEELKSKCEPEMRVKETKKMTPVGGMLKETAPIEQVQVAEKLILSSDKLRELLYLPAYLLPKATDFSRKLLKYFYLQFLSIQMIF